MQRPTIAIIGAGAVGATTAYALTLKNLAAAVLLIDIDQEKEAGEVMDISNTLSFVETGSVARGEFRDAASADIIIITAGYAQRMQQGGACLSRLELLEKNAMVLRSIFSAMGRLKKEAIVIVVTNPVDILTLLAQKLSKLPRQQVFGSGTTLDTARLRSALAQTYDVSAQNVQGFVLGEHGNSQCIAWSSVALAGIPVTKLPKWSKKKEAQIAENVKTEAQRIIECKGATYYGIAMTVTDIVEAILLDQKKVLPVSSYLSSWNGISGVCMGVPAVIGRHGVERLWPLPLSTEEKKLLLASARILREHAL